MDKHFSHCGRTGIFPEFCHFFQKICDSQSAGFPYSGIQYLPDLLRCLLDRVLPEDLAIIRDDPRYYLPDGTLIIFLYSFREKQNLFQTAAPFSLCFLHHFLFTDSQPEYIRATRRCTSPGCNSKPPFINL